MPFICTDLQTVEPEALTPSGIVTVTISTDLDRMGFNRADVVGPTRESVIDYVRANWGDEDGDWFKEYVTDRIHEYGITVAVEEYAAELVRLVRHDLATEPQRFGSAKSWTDLHDVCDANEYLIDADAKFGLEYDGHEDEYLALANAAIAIAEKTLFGTRYELCEFYREPQVTDGKTWIEDSVGDGFATLTEAVQFATAHLSSRGWSGADDRHPWVGVIQSVIEGDERTGFAFGWVTPDGNLTEGDYENDESLWGVV